jgi:Uma2 family endonuclease
MSLEADILIKRREPPPAPVTFEEFLAWCDDETWGEWVDGQVILMPVVVAEIHARIVNFLHWLLSEVSDLGVLGDVRGEPYQMRLPVIPSSRAPDLFFIRAERRHLLQRHYLDGPADLVVEVVSPESTRRDYITKLAEYERAGVPEYWLVDGEAQQAELRQLGPDGKYRVVLAGTTGEYRSSVLPSLVLRLDWLWQHPGPDRREVLRVLGLR